MSIIFVTSKSQKAAEVATIMDTDIVWREYDLKELQSIYLGEVVRDKVRQAYDLCRMPVLVEDVAFCLTALKGFPGTYVRSWQEHVGFDHALVIADALGWHGARAFCGVGYYDGRELQYVGRDVVGKLVPRRGESGFGFDPYFLPNNSTETFAEMGPERKNRCSHRFHAWSAMRDLLRSKGIF